MKQNFNKTLVYLILIIFLISSISVASAQGLSPQHVADKTVTHGYALIDAYIKELPDFTCAFPKGQFSFTLINGDDVLISPGCIDYIDDKMWRTITFSHPDGSVYAIVLDGPVYGEPGTPNEEAIADAKNALLIFLSESNMTIKKIFRDDVNLDLSSENDLQIFIDIMFNSIELSAPLTGTEPTAIRIPKGILVKVNPIDEKPIEVASIPASVKQIKTQIDFEEGEREIEINVDKVRKESKIEINKKVVTTDKGIEIKDSRLFIETSVGPKEIKVLPEEASSKAVEVTTVNEIKLEEKETKPVYSVKGIKSAKILFVIPVEVEIETKVSAETGDVISVNKPWWSFLAW